jgi:hypothetical protein
LLERRQAAKLPGPVEVSLGYAGSYYVRFHDGSEDYLVPAAMASVMEQPEGCCTTSVHFHPSLPGCYVMRHS